MKKIFFTLAMLITTMVSASAMTYEQARNEALFLTDKMAYELNLNTQQYDAAYEINLDYLMGVNTVDDVYAECWRQRNLDLQYVLLDWQYNAFCAASYFYRPLYWGGGFWHFGVYAHYPRHDFFYFDRPGCFVSYRGGHSWRFNGGHSWYISHEIHFVERGGRGFCGMRDSRRGGCMSYQRGGNMSYQRGSSFRGGTGSAYRSGEASRGNISSGRSSAFGGNTSGMQSRQSSTRTTMSNNQSHNNSSFGSGNSSMSHGNSSFGGGSSSMSHGNSSFGGGSGMTRSGGGGNNSFGGGHGARR